METGKIGDHRGTRGRERMLREGGNIVGCCGNVKLDVEKVRRLQIRGVQGEAVYSSTPLFPEEFISVAVWG